MTVHKVIPSEKASAICFPLVLIGNEHGVSQGSMFDSTLEEGGPPLFNVVFTSIVEGFLGEPQVTLTNLFR